MLLGETQAKPTSCAIDGGVCLPCVVVFSGAGSHLVLTKWWRSRASLSASLFRIYEVPKTSAGNENRFLPRLPLAPRGVADKVFVFPASCNHASPASRVRHTLGHEPVMGTERCLLAPGGCGFGAERLTSSAPIQLSNPDARKVYDGARLARPPPEGTVTLLRSLFGAQRGSTTGP